LKRAELQEGRKEGREGGRKGGREENITFTFLYNNIY
jgi:hypothetical protein